MSKTVKYNDHVFHNVPDGFIKMGLVLTFSPKEIGIWEQHILRMLVRDYYIFYATLDKFDDGKFTELHFFCRPKDEISITYQIGILFQTMFARHRPLQDVIEASHQVPSNYPKCIFIKSEQVSKGNLDDGPIYKCPECNYALAEIKPGRHQCVNQKCVTNKITA